jgi:hypothetical protein
VRAMGAMVDAALWNIALWYVVGVTRSSMGFANTVFAAEHYLRNADAVDLANLRESGGFAGGGAESDFLRHGRSVLDVYNIVARGLSAHLTGDLRGRPFYARYLGEQINFLPRLIEALDDRSISPLVPTTLPEAIALLAITIVLYRTLGFDKVKVLLRRLLSLKGTTTADASSQQHSPAPPAPAVPISRRHRAHSLPAAVSNWRPKSE